MSEYITDPELLKQLNTNEYVADPELLAMLNSSEPTQEMPNPGDYSSVQAGMSAARPAAQAAYGATGNIRDMYTVGKNVLNATPGGIKEMVSNPMQTAKAYARGHPYMMSGAGGMARGIGSAIAGPIAAPENLFTLPYTMAAYEQEKIRANPNLPEYQNNPYAQMYRGEAATQNKAGEANRMKALTSMPYGNVTPQERQMLDEDMRIRSAVRKKALEKVMGPVAPGRF